MPSIWAPPLEKLRAEKSFPKMAQRNEIREVKHPNVRIYFHSLFSCCIGKMAIPLVDIYHLVQLVIDRNLLLLKTINCLNLFYLHSICFFALPLQQVAWMHFEQSAILTVHNHVITRNPRISVTHDKHDKHKTWYLHIGNVQEEDKGRYMCQINTVTAKTQFGYLHVVGTYRSNVVCWTSPHAYLILFSNKWYFHSPFAIQIRWR